MFEATIIQIILKGGPLAVSVFIAYIFFGMNERIKKIEENLAQKQNKSESEKINDGVINRLDVIENKIDSLKDDTVSKADHYHDISGWRTEINRLDEKLDKYIINTRIK